MIEFTKMHGCGNDYIYVDGMSQSIDDPASLAVAMSDRHRGIGADGLILILEPQHAHQADLRMRIFNADGSEAEMCGNGIRCVCKYAHDRNLTRANPMRIETGAGVLSLEFSLDDEGLVDRVKVDMGEPILSSGLIPVEFPRSFRKDSIVDFPLDKYIPLGTPASWMEDCQLDMHMTCVSMGNPHLIVYCGNVRGVPLEMIGPFMERQSIFPNRINVHFVQVVSSDEIIMRTWERGSGITQACGTGACAVCVAGVISKRTDRTLLAHLPGGDLELEWNEASNHVLMKGPAVEVCQGQWNDVQVREGVRL